MGGQKYETPADAGEVKDEQPTSETPVEAVEDAAAPTDVPVAEEAAEETQGTVEEAVTE